MNNKKSVYQYSIYEALLKGYFKGEHSVSEFMEYGNFGLGTFDNLEGELIVLDGEFYQIKEDGKIYTPPSTNKIPFIQLVWFEKDKEFTIENTIATKKFEKMLKDSLSKNHIIAFQIDGTFVNLKVRSFPKQESIAPGIDLTRLQKIYNYEEAKGTVVGYYFPAFFNNLSQVGVHLHFISEDRRFGGHVLDTKIGPGVVKCQQLSAINLELPKETGFF